MTSDWMARCVGSADSGGHADNAADRTLIAICSAAFDASNQWPEREGKKKIKRRQRRDLVPHVRDKVQLISPVRTRRDAF